MKNAELAAPDEMVPGRKPGILTKPESGERRPNPPGFCLAHGVFSQAEDDHGDTRQLCLAE